MNQLPAACKSVFLFLFLLFTSSLLAQVRQPYVPQDPVLPSINCGSDGALKELRKDAGFRTREEAMNRAILSAARLQDDEILTLPVVFHIVRDNPSDVSDAFIKEKLQELNDAYANAGAFSNSKGVDTRIRFCLAQKDPDGGLTTGINRVKSFFGTSLSPHIEDGRLKKLVQWDANRYINIWYVQSMEEEWTAIFTCGNWVRSRYGGYANMPPGGGALDGIVVSGFGSLLVHEMGHYLGLYHTFEGFNCQNSNCETDGDRVCDTPPDRSLNSSPCSSPENSCFTDTLSGFTSDMPDPVDNYMDYGNSGCVPRFTKGQAERMKAIVAGFRSGLVEAACQKPCTDDVTAFIQRNIPYPLPGENITFTPVTSGAIRYEWLVDGVVAATTTNFSRSFANTGKYKVTLKAYTASGCYASYSDFVIVTCGVTARFWTNKRTIASKEGVLLDSILFTNTSEKATAYKWLMRTSPNAAEQVVSTEKNLTYVFKQPGTYTVRLIATNGSCTDTTELYIVPVYDPTPEGQLNVWDVSCYQQTKVRVTFWICNNGYFPIKAGVPISFYDADPRTGTANKLGPMFILPADIPGLCCTYFYTHVVDVGKAGLNQLYAVFNDSGTTKPLRLPNTPLIERDYNNNIGFRNNFAFKVNAIPAQSTVEPGDTIQLRAFAGPGFISSYQWQSPYNLNCPTCSTTNLIADTTCTKFVVATSTLGCYDTARVSILVPPANDYTVTIDKAACAANDQLHLDFTLRNSFKRGVIPKGLTVSFYSGDPATNNAVLLPPVFTISDTVKAKLASFSTTIKGIENGRIYAVVNDGGVALPVNLPNTAFLEKAYTNNSIYYEYKPEEVVLQPADTIVLRKETVPLTITSSVTNPGSIVWQGGNGYTLSCTSCPSAIATVTDSSKVQMQMLNAYGCVIKGEANIKVFPPDMTVSILESKCFTNSTVQVRFEVCMNNNYDTVWNRIPIAFYEGNPTGGSAKLLQPVFYTPAKLPGECFTFTHQITAPSGKDIFAVVNDKGGTAGRVFEETDYTNNAGSTTYQPFVVSVTPADTSIPRLSSVELTSSALGGTLTSWAWQPVRYVSCTDCPVTTAAPPYTLTYQLVARNENACTDTAYALVKTFTNGLIHMPNAFTPNADGTNDVFYVLAGAEARTIKDFSIFNRWGEKVFQATNVPPNDPVHGWKGRYKGRDAMGGVYVYYVTLVHIDGHEEVYKGTVVLIR
jgi:gliding motility-associated-like protein